MDYLLTLGMSFAIWFVLTRTRRMWKHLEKEEEQTVKREMIVIKHSLTENQPAAPAVDGAPQNAC